MMEAVGSFFEGLFMIFADFLIFELCGFVLSSGGGWMFWFFLVAIASEEVFIGCDEGSIAVAIEIIGLFMHVVMIMIINMVIDFNGMDK